MTYDPGTTTVYFACSKCLLPYRTTQQRRTEPVSGCIDCVRCGEPVHRWSGLYDFVGWQQPSLAPQVQSCP